MMAGPSAYEGNRVFEATVCFSFAGEKVWGSIVFHAPTSSYVLVVDDNLESRFDQPLASSRLFQTPMHPDAAGCRTGKVCFLTTQPSSEYAEFLKLLSSAGLVVTRSTIRLN